MNQKVYEAQALVDAHAKAASKDQRRLSRAAELYLSLKKDMEVAWADENGALSFKTDGFRVFYHQALDGLSRCYDAMGLAEEAMPYLDELMRADYCATSAGGSPREYEGCSGSAHSKLISYSRQLGRPQVADEYFRRARKVQFRGQRVHQWETAWQTPTWFTPGLSSAPFWTEKLELSKVLERNSDALSEEFQALLADPAHRSSFEERGGQFSLSGRDKFGGPTWSEACQTVLKRTCELLRGRPELGKAPKAGSLRGAPLLGEAAFFGDAGFFHPWKFVTGADDYYYSNQA